VPDAPPWAGADRAFGAWPFPPPDPSCDFIGPPLFCVCCVPCCTCGELDELEAGAFVFGEEHATKEARHIPIAVTVKIFFIMITPTHKLNVVVSFNSFNIHVPTEDTFNVA
jgi:hypothetical protein